MVTSKRGGTCKNQYPFTATTSSSTFISKYPLLRQISIPLVIPFLENCFSSLKMQISEFQKAQNEEKFSPFQIHSTSYKVVNEHPIGVDVLVPKDLKPETRKCPLIVRFHGGYLVSNLCSIISSTKDIACSLTRTTQVTGASLAPLFFNTWILELAGLKGAIIVSADYRLVPEATGADILADASDLWKWIRSDL